MRGLPGFSYICRPAGAWYSSCGKGRGRFNASVWPCAAFDPVGGAALWRAGSIASWRFRLSARLGREAGKHHRRDQKFRQSGKEANHRPESAQFHRSHPQRSGQAIPGVQYRLRASGSYALKRMNAQAVRKTKANRPSSPGGPSPPPAFSASPKLTNPPLMRYNRPRKSPAASLRTRGGQGGVP